VKSSGTLTITTSIWIGNYSALERSLICGYSSTRGDGGQVTIACSTNSVNMFTFQGTMGNEIANFSLVNTASSPGAGFYDNYAWSSYTVLRNITISGCLKGIDGVSSAAWNQLLLFNCEIKSCTSDGVNNSGYTYMWGCYLHGNGGDGFKMTGGSANAYMWGTVDASNTGVGFHDAASNSSRIFQLIGCVAYNNTGDGANSNQSSGNQGITSINGIYYGNGGYGINFPSYSATGNPWNLQQNNAFGSNTSGARSSGMPGGTGDVSLSANPFTSPSTGDFTLNSTAGGGAACKAAGYQSSLI
jgi:hypothetical protein